MDGLLVGVAQAPSSRSRPTIGASMCRDGRSADDGEQPVGGDRLRLALELERLERLDLDRVARRARSVSAPIRISPGCAACSSRAATLTASPVASRSAVPVTTSPVLTPIRAWTPSSGSASRISTAARQARRASSSCTWGTPNTAITASPMNFSTVPPCDSTIPFIRSK